jgi:hypothetical protein
MINFLNIPATEKECIDFFIQCKYGQDKPYCLQHPNAASRVRSDFIFVCKECKTTFSIFSNSIFVKSRKPLRDRYYLLYMRGLLNTYQLTKECIDFEPTNLYRFFKRCGGDITLVESIVKWVDSKYKESGQLEILDIDVRDSYNRTALHRAVIFNQLHVVKQLIKDGIDTNAKDKGGYTALYYAAKKNRDDIVSYLTDNNVFN